MNKRDKQREATRSRILEAALRVFSDNGFAAAGTREIANQAGVNQGLITYHFKSKDILWREAANKIFSEARTTVVEEVLRNADVDKRTLQKNMVKAYVRFVAKRPELLRFMVEEGKQPSERVRWLVDNHLKPMYENFPIAPSDDENLKPHVFYAMVGAAALMFAVRPVCKRLTGIDPHNKDVIETHAEFIAGLLVP
ncbi:MAG: TetR/AcrR family transcriptional regulator [Bacteroidetes bacterium]|nr:TetR/AcrR family transcriptional regulator [Bacteroidota bacterium]